MLFDVVTLTVEGVGTGAIVDVVLLTVGVETGFIVVVVDVDVDVVVVSMVADNLPTIPEVRLSVRRRKHRLT